MARKYAPALTKQQFKAIRPQGNYGNYLDYLERKRPGWSRPQAARPQRVPPPMRGPSYTYDLLSRRLQILTPQQMEAQANRMAQAQIKAQKGMMNEEYKRAQDDAMRRMLAFQSAGRAAAAMNSSLIGQVGGQYQAGADQLSQLASAGAASMAGATDASVAAGNAAISNAGVAPPVTVGGPAGAPGIAGSTQAGVEQYYGGTLGAQALQNAGGYAQAGAAGQISAQNLRATQEAQAAYMSAQGEADRNRASAIREMAQGRPAMAMQYLQQLQDNQRQAIALASSLVGAGFEQGMTKKEYGQKVKQQNVQNKQWLMEFNEKTRQFNKSLQQTVSQNNIEMGTIDASASRAWGYLVNKAGQPILKNGKPIPVASYSGAGAKKGGLTPYQMSRLMPRAQEAAESYYSGYVNVNGKRVLASTLTEEELKGKTVTGAVNYQTAMNRLTRMGVPGTTARAILNEQYQLPGEGGRPAFTPEEAKAIRKFYGPKQYKWLVSSIRNAAEQNNWDLVEQLYNNSLAGKQLAWVGKR